MQIFNKIINVIKNILNDIKKLKIFNNIKTILNIIFADLRNSSKILKKWILRIKTQIKNKNAMNIDLIDDNINDKKIKNILSNLNIEIKIKRNKIEKKKKLKKKLKKIKKKNKI